METIFMLSRNGGPVRSIDIVNELDYTKPSVSVAMKNLRESGYIVVDAGGFISLTDSGRKIARSMYDRHTLISDWLIFLGVDKETAADDACKIEHDMSEKSYVAIKKHIKGVKTVYGDWLKGTWRLDSFTAADEEDSVTNVMGDGASGFICYSGDGWVSVQIIRANRQRYDIPDVEGGTVEQTLSAARGLFAYAGRYTVDEENAVVYHHLEFSLIPNWIGSTQKRYITKESENVLILSADPVRMGPDGKKRKSRLRWVKIDPA